MTGLGQSRAGTAISSGAASGRRPHSSWSRQWLIRAGAPRALAATDDLPPDEFVFYSSVILGDADRAVRVVHDLERGTDVMDNVIWWDLARPMRQTAGFRRLVGAVGLEQLWRARGWPDKCRPKGAGDFVCD